MNKFDRLCKQLFKANIPFSQNDGIISIQPDNANINIYISVYTDTPFYCWYKKINFNVEIGTTQNLQNLLALIINFYADYENTP